MASPSYCGSSLDVSIYKNLYSITSDNYVTVMLFVKEVTGDQKLSKNSGDNLIRQELYNHCV